MNRKKARWILWYETLGFACLIALSWLNELISLPHLLFGAGPHSNWHEAMLETMLLVAVWLVVLFFTRRLLARVYHLEGFLRVCGWCRKIGHDHDWRTLEDYFAHGFNIKTSHGVCPDCREKWVAETKLKAA